MISTSFGITLTGDHKKDSFKQSNYSKINLDLGILRPILKFGVDVIIMFSLSDSMFLFISFSGVSTSMVESRSYARVLSGCSDLWFSVASGSSTSSLKRDLRPRVRLGPCSLSRILLQ